MFATVGILGLAVFTPGAIAVPSASAGTVPSPKMFGYAAGPGQHDGTAAGKAHYVSASDTFPAGLTTSYTYDSQDRLVTETDPPITDRVTGAVHQGDHQHLRRRLGHADDHGQR